MWVKVIFFFAGLVIMTLLINGTTCGKLISSFGMDRATRVFSGGQLACQHSFDGMSRAQRQLMTGRNSWIITPALFVMSCAGIVAAPCSSDVLQTWVVNDSQSAVAMAAAVNCSGGVFTVDWKGNIVVEHEIFVAGGTSLSVSGSGSEAGMIGGGDNRLFTVENAHLNVSNMTISNGNASYGGAIVSGGSSLLFHRTSFIRNVAAQGDGGALHLVNSSTVLWGGLTTFVNNTADGVGGAVFISSSSNVSWRGKTSFSNNSAQRGGAVHVEGNSRVSWEAETSFSSNIANLTGGGLNVYNGSTVSWEAATSFSDNIGQWGGGVHVERNSRVSWEDETLFSGNHAPYGGGAGLDVYDGSRASWRAATKFIDNNATEKGGAVQLYANSVVSWVGNTSFVNSSAKSGGALSAGDNCSVSWAAETSFIGNSASCREGALENCHGGALAAFDSCRVFWEGETSFIGNSASFNGGALYAGDDSSVSWEGRTSFSNNSAVVSGGAMILFSGSSASWAGNTSFSYNSADDNAGAVYALNRSSVSWEAETLFAVNSAKDAGGAVLIEYGSNISWEADTSFRNNVAGISGGALSISSSNENSEDIMSSIIISGSTMFEENRCRSGGGAMAIVGVISALFRPETMTFIGNSADIAGGAVFVAGSGKGPQFIGVTFISNSADAGGAVFVTGSGTAVKNYEFLYPTTFDQCQFIGNEARLAGGAVESGAGQDFFTSTSFFGNVAQTGGALSLAGTASLFNCTFIENTSAEDEGPAISNTGSIVIVSASFADNTFACEPGTFLDFNVSGDIFDTVCNGCETTCNETCTFEGEIPLCTEELEHSVSAGGNVTLEMLSIGAGYWRATNDSKNILACYNADACRGGITGEADYCQYGYEGPYCSICSQGYTASLGFACNKCSDNDGEVVFMVVIAVLAMVAFAAFLFHTMSGEREGADRGFVARVTRYIPLQSLKIVIVAWQILTQFSSVANVTYPDVYQRFLDGVDVLNFDLSWIFSAGCIFDVDFHARLLMSTIGPLIGMAILGATYSVAVRRNSGSDAALGHVRQKHLSMMLLLMFVVYSSVAATLFQMFACDELDNGKNYLRADYRIECDSSRHEALQIYAGFMIFLYTVGIPLFYATLLFRNRDVLMDTFGRENDMRVKSTTDLWKPYKPDRFFYEVIECGRRILLAGVVVFIYPNTAAQIAVTLVMAVFFMVVSEALAPYVSRWDTWTSRTGHVIIFLSMYVALLLKVRVSDEGVSSQRVFEVILVSANVCMIAAVAVEAVVVAYSFRQQVREDANPLIRTSRDISFVQAEDDARPHEVDKVETDETCGRLSRVNKGTARVGCN